MGFGQKPVQFFRHIQIGPKLAYKFGLGFLIGRFILLLTTRGRKSGRPHVVPLQYEEVQGVYYVCAARGDRADWYRNLLAHPEADVRVKGHTFHAVAEPITNPVQIADFLELRLKRHPRMVKAMLSSEGMSSNTDRPELEVYASSLVLVKLVPV